MKRVADEPSLTTVFNNFPLCRKFVIWKDYESSESFLCKVIPADIDNYSFAHRPSDKINWFKVIFNKRYRYGLKCCFDYAAWHADTDLGVGASDAICGIKTLMDLEYNECSANAAMVEVKKEQ